MLTSLYRIALAKRLPELGCKQGHPMFVSLHFCRGFSNGFSELLLDDEVEHITDIVPTGQYTPGSQNAQNQNRRQLANAAAGFPRQPLDQ